MEITIDQMKESIKRIYAMLEEVSPLDFDCGKLCGEVCCLYDDGEYQNRDLVLYLIPGEELMYEDSDSFELYHVSSEELGYPSSCGEDLFVAECRNPPHCDRSIRPIQCRTFPLVPHISDEGKLQLILDENEIPYVCPIMRDKIKLNDDFVELTYRVWSGLIKNPTVYEQVFFDSRLRDENKKGYTVVK